MRNSLSTVEIDCPSLTKRALTVGLRTDVSVRQLHELYAVTDMVALVGVARLDSKIVQHGAISAIKLGE